MRANSVSRILLPVCVLVSGTLHSAAAIVEYQLFNHPDGAARPPKYGLRLDELFDITSGHDVFTFDFEHASSRMRLFYDDADTPTDLSDDEVRIVGTVYGGLDRGTDFHPDYSGVWEVDFRYTENVVSGGTQIEVGPNSLNNTGYIRSTFGMGNNDPIPLWDEDGNHGFSFKFNNTDNHRLDGHGISGPEWFVGWGWLNHGDPNQHVYSSDWLFTAKVVPEPGAVAALIAGLSTLLVRRRKR